MTKKCPYCGREYPEVSRFCPYCGRPNPDKFPAKHVEEPEMHWVRQLVLFLVGFLGFQIVGMLVEIPFILKAYADFGDNSKLILKYIDSAPVSMFINAITYSIIFSVLLLMAKPHIKVLCKSFTDKKAYIAALIGCLAIYAFNMAFSMFLNLSGVDITSNNNQQALDSIIKIYPIASIIVFGFIGPICEEVTYRVGLFGVLKRKNRIFGYILTIVIFTFIHFDFSASNIVNELINIPYYAFAAFAFTYLYDNYGFAASISAHVLNNLVSVILSMF